MINPGRSSISKIIPSSVDLGMPHMENELSRPNVRSACDDTPGGRATIVGTSNASHCVIVTVLLLC